ncbi:Alpha/Beta hydrolase protein [Aspergillus desertorum]
MDWENVDHLQAAAQRVRAAYLKVVHSASISDLQHASLRDDPVKGQLWVSKFTTPKPTQDTSRELLLSLIDELNERNIPYDRPDSGSLKFEWVGYRHDAKKDTPEPASLSESGKFQRLNAETKGTLTILYVYGGTFALNTPSCYRRTTSFLAKETGAKVLMVHQRLAPQNPFPAALLDVVQAYLTLLAPPPCSPHAAISPSSIVLAGDSSGSCLALGLLQVLLRLKRKGQSILFHGHKVEPVVPAGIAVVSPIADLAASLPSFESNAKTDIFQQPHETLPYLLPGYPTCQLWPTHPPRANLYCEPAMLAHPLASPAGSDDWTGCCPIWMASGQEQGIDSALLIAQVAHSQGVSVILQEYEGMPHTFFFTFRDAPQTKMVFAEWAGAILGFSKGLKRPSGVCFIRAKGLIAEHRAVKNLVPFTVPEVRERMWVKSQRHKLPAHFREDRSNL